MGGDVGAEGEQQPIVSPAAASRRRDEEGLSGAPLCRRRDPPPRRRGERGEAGAEAGRRAGHGAASPVDRQEHGEEGNLFFLDVRRSGEDPQGPRSQ